MDGVFVDTSGFIALEDAGDRYHAQARRFQSLVRHERLRLVTTNYVLDETYTWIRLHLGHRPAVRFGEAIQSSELVTVIWISAALERQAWSIFAQYDDKTFSFTDCTSFAIMQQLGLDRAFAFDLHFVQFGFQLSPGAG